MRKNRQIPTKIRHRLPFARHSCVDTVDLKARESSPSSSQYLCKSRVSTQWTAEGSPEGKLRRTALCVRQTVLTRIPSSGSLA